MMEFARKWPRFLKTIFSAALQWTVRNERGYLKEKLKSDQKEVGLLYKCPFENEYYEILQMFSCSTDPRFVNDTQGKSYLEPNFSYILDNITAKLLPNHQS